MMQISLPNAFKNNPRLHAYMYVSCDKAARSSQARNIAMSMLCRSRASDGTPCGECDCCKKITAGFHPDCIVFSNGEKTSVKEIRTIENEAYLSPNEADSKVFILEDADGYNAESQNALLKILEEPPKGVCFVLTSSSAGAVLRTVRSRVCVLSGGNKTKEQISQEIKNAAKGLDEQSIDRLSHFVMAYDTASADSLNTKELLEYTQLCSDFLSGRDSSALFAMPKKREELAVCLQVFMLCIRQIVVTKATGAVCEGIMEASQLVSCNSKVSMKKANMLYDIFEEAFLQTQNNGNESAVLGYIWSNIK